MVTRERDRYSRSYSAHDDVFPDPRGPAFGRWRRLRAIKLRFGTHESLETGACVLEAASYVAGENFSDEPDCVCPVIGAFVRAWNDALPDDATRTRLLLPLIPRLIRSRSTPAVESRRSWLALDWLQRAPHPLPDSDSAGARAAALPAENEERIADGAADRAADEDVSSAAQAAAAAHLAAWTAEHEARIASNAAHVAAWTATWAGAWTAEACTLRLLGQMLDL